MARRYPHSWPASLSGSSPADSAGCPSRSPPHSGASLGPIAWNAILRATHGTTFSTDAPIAVMPASWQDTGSGVFALGATTILLGLGLLRHEPARRTVSLALLAGLAAFLVDVYLY